jgi:hypothetical protein
MLWSASRRDWSQEEYKVKSTFKIIRFLLTTSYPAPNNDLEPAAPVPPTSTGPPPQTTPSQAPQIRKSEATLVKKPHRPGTADTAWYVHILPEFCQSLPPSFGIYSGANTWPPTGPTSPSKPRRYTRTLREPRPDIEKGNLGYFFFGYSKELKIFWLQNYKEDASRLKTEMKKTAKGKEKETSSRREQLEKFVKSVCTAVLIS